MESYQLKEVIKVILGTIIFTRTRSSNHSNETMAIIPNIHYCTVPLNSFVLSTIQTQFDCNSQSILTLKLQFYKQQVKQFYYNWISGPNNIVKEEWIIRLVKHIPNDEKEQKMLILSLERQLRASILYIISNNVGEEANEEIDLQYKIIMDDNGKQVIKEASKADSWRKTLKRMVYEASGSTSLK